MGFGSDSTTDVRLKYTYVENDNKTEPIICPICGKYLGEKYKDVKGHIKLWCKQDKKEVTITL